MRNLFGLVTLLGLVSPAWAQEKTIYETVADSDQFTTLTKAIKAADLTDTLKGNGPFTVLAPTDEAFRRLPEGKLEELMKPENKERLADLLKLHVIKEKVTASQASQLSGRSVATACPRGTKCTINAVGGSVSFSCGGNTGRVLKPDIMASNGVIHAIDAVLMPAAK